MRRAVLILTLSGMLAYSTHAASKGHPQQQEFQGKTLNMGIRIGFNSSMFFIDKFNIGDNAIQNIQNNYKVGYFGSFFWRINMKKHHFLQPEILYNVANGSISTPRIKENENVLSGNALIKSTIHSINLPILYGYKFVDVEPYGMAFFVGPEISYTWRKYTNNEYSGFYQQQIAETTYPFRLQAMLGLSVNVSKVFFDFRYGIGLYNMVKDINFDSSSTPAPYNSQPIVLKRRCNELSFSVGVLF